MNCPEHPRHEMMKGTHNNPNSWYCVLCCESYELRKVRKPYSYEPMGQ